MPDPVERETGLEPATACLEGITPRDEAISRLTSEYPFGRLSRDLSAGQLRLYVTAIRPLALLPLMATTARQFSLETMLLRSTEIPSPLSWEIRVARRSAGRR
jgi:hypothetical protein